MPHSWHTLAHERNSKSKQQTLYDTRGPDKFQYTMMQYGRHFTAVTQALNTKAFSNFWLHVYYHRCMLFFIVFVNLHVVIIFVNYE